MKKVSILTMHSVCNYGTQLQALATQEKFKEFFDNVEFIDYRRKDTYGIELMKTYSKGNILRALAVLPTLLYWRHVFLGFQKKYLNIGKPRHLNDSTISDYKVESDAYIVGSDQVWNSGWNKGVIPAMFLSFIPSNVPKYSYASSFGKKKLEEREINESKKYIDEFRFLSVREDSGVEILKKQYNYKNVERIIDPTLIMPSSFWKKYSGKER